MSRTRDAVKVLLLSVCIWSVGGDRVDAVTKAMVANRGTGSVTVFDMDTDKIVAEGGPDGKAKIVLTGKGAALSDPTLPLASGTKGIRVQLTNPSSGTCWESEFPFGTVRVDDDSIKGKVP